MNPIQVSRIVLPGHLINSSTAEAGETIDAFVARSGWAVWRGQTGWDFNLPTICVRNGLPVSRHEWQVIRVSGEDQLTFLARPMGGRATTKSVIGIAAAISLAFFAPWAGGLIAGAFFSGSVVAAGIASAAISAKGPLWIKKGDSQRNEIAMRLLRTQPA